MVLIAQKIRKQWSDFVPMTCWLPKSLDSTEHSKNSYSFVQCHPCSESLDALHTRFLEVLVYNNFLKNFHGQRKKNTNKPQENCKLLKNAEAKINILKFMRVTAYNLQNCSF